MRQSIIAVLTGIAALSTAVAIAPPGDSVYPVPGILPGVALSAHKIRDDSPNTNEGAFSASTNNDDESSVSTRAGILPVAPFLTSHTRDTNEVAEDKCKRDTATDESHDHDCDKQPDDKDINKSNDKLSDKPLERIADCLGTNKDMVEEYCDCMGNCKVLRAYYRSLVLSAKGEITEGRVENHFLVDEVCQVFLGEHEEPMVSQMLAMTKGMTMCSPGSDHRV
jgi:hypothetical protein